MHRSVTSGQAHSPLGQPNTAGPIPEVKKKKNSFNKVLDYKKLYPHKKFIESK